MVQHIAATLLQRHRRTDGRINWPSVLGEPLLVPMLVVLAVVWLLPHNPYPARLTSALATNLRAYTPTIPSVHIDTHPSVSFQSRYPANKTALYIEPRSDIPFMIPLLLHMMLVVPPDWRFVFFGSAATVERVRGSYTAAMYEGLGKLHVRDLAETWWGQQWGRDGWEEGSGLQTEEIRSRLLTNSSFYERELRGVEWLLVWHSDAILCANAEVGLDEWLGWDWVGAPWTDGRRYGGNGGLSIRKVSKVLEVLEFQKRLDNTAPEDLWMSSRLETIPHARMCPPDKAREFAVADIWHEWPLGFHINPAALAPNIWKPLERRKQIFEYCPELKIIMDMALDREKCVEQIEAEREESMLWQQNLQQTQNEGEKPKTPEEVEEEQKKQVEEESRAKQKQKDEETRAKKQKEKEIYDAAMKKHKSAKESGEAKTKAVATGRVRKPEHFDTDEEPESGKVGFDYGFSGEHGHGKAKESDFHKYDHASGDPDDEKKEDGEKDLEFANDEPEEAYGTGDSKDSSAKSAADVDDGEYADDGHGEHSDEEADMKDGHDEHSDERIDMNDGHGEHSDNKAEMGEDQARHADEKEDGVQSEVAKDKDNDANVIDLNEYINQDQSSDKPIPHSDSGSDAKVVKDGGDEFDTDGGPKLEDEQLAENYGGLALDYPRMGNDRDEES